MVVYFPFKKGLSLVLLFTLSAVFLHLSQTVPTLIPSAIPVLLQTRGELSAAAYVFILPHKH